MSVFILAWIINLRACRRERDRSVYNREHGVVRVAAMRGTLQVVLDDGDCDDHHHDLIKGSAVVGPPNYTVQ